MFILLAVCVCLCCTCITCLITVSPRLAACVESCRFLKLDYVNAAQANARPKALLENKLFHFG